MPAAAENGPHHPRSPCLEPVAMTPVSNSATNLSNDNALLQISEDSVPSSTSYSHDYEVSSSGSNSEMCNSQSQPSLHGDIGSGIQSPRPNATLEERIEYLIESARTAGFESLDDAVIQYYTADLSDDSMSSTAQRLGRKRSLPKLLGKLRHETKAWKFWEVYAYRDAILSSSEDLLLAEMRQFSARRDGRSPQAFGSRMLQDGVCFPPIMRVLSSRKSC